MRKIENIESGGVRITAEFHSPSAAKHAADVLEVKEHELGKLQEKLHLALKAMGTIGPEADAVCNEVSTMRFQVKELAASCRDAATRLSMQGKEQSHE